MSKQGGILTTRGRESCLLIMLLTIMFVSFERKHKYRSDAPISFGRLQNIS